MQIWHLGHEVQYNNNNSNILKKIAVIDLGSNTFHLLIVNVGDDHTFETIYRERVFTGLSDGGIDVIKNEKIVFGLDTIRHFKKKLDQYEVSEIKVIGTAVLRKASNRQHFIDEAHGILNTEIKIIDGHTEAAYIYKGIMLLPSLRTGTHLIMDIGGGSTEFILVSEGEKIWSESYTLGVGVLHSLFHHDEPIAKTSIEEMKAYVENILKDMLSFLKNYTIENLIGASGSFEVLQSMTSKEIGETNISIISIAEFEKIYDIIVRANYGERSKMHGLPLERAKLIVVGIVLKKIISDLVKPLKIVVSPFALKEGVLSDMI
jgi:exopolyphosphatase / guanosine-5'-triphosphate,3'-diphosphate pyrophosphatase